VVGVCVKSISEKSPHHAYTANVGAYNGQNQLSLVFSDFSWRGLPLSVERVVEFPSV
jgi:hypothetical protein